MGSKRRLGLAAIGLLLAVCGTAHAATIVVSPGGSIQSAIDAAGSGDTVLVQDGEYVVLAPVSFKGKSITVRSDNGPVVTTIRMSTSPTNPQRTSVVIFENGETDSSVLEGFTLTGGQGTLHVGAGIKLGGGVYCDGGSPSLVNCEIVSNSAVYGGGLCFVGASPAMTDCTVATNTAQAGGGIWCQGSSMVLDTCTVDGNTATGHGGGIFATVGSTPDLTDCTISGNSAGAGSVGGGLYFYQAQSGTTKPEVTRCEFSENEAGSGGGTYCYQSAPTLTECTFRENEAASGAGAYCNQSSPTLTDCTFQENAAGGNGGGLNCIDASAPSLLRCIFSLNTAGERGGGISCWTNTSPTIDTCTISGNSAAAAWTGGGIACWSSSPTITDCSITGNSGGLGGGVCCEEGSSPTLTGCTITGNSASGALSGGGVACLGSSPDLIRCDISGNTSGDAAGGGGVACFSGSSPTLTHCAITGNRSSSAEGGGGVQCEDQSSPTLTSCTIADNESGNFGGGVYCNDQCSPTMRNVILWGNTATAGGPEIALRLNSNLGVDYCDIADGQLAAHVEGGCNLNWGAGNMDAAPRFAGPGHWDDAGTPGDTSDDVWVKGDYHLKSTGGRYNPATGQWVVDAVDSPCIDSGDPASDWSAEPEANGDRINMGRYGGTAEASKSETGPIIARSPDALSPQCDEGTSPGDETFDIWNAGGGQLNYTISESPDVAWITGVIPNGGTSTGQHNTHTVSLAASMRQPGVHNATLRIADPAAIPQEATVSVALTVSNVLPTVTIDSMTPNPADPLLQGVHLNGTAFDAVGSITRYEWRSDIDGVLGDQEDIIFPLDTISVGTHQITFEAWDDDGTSNTATGTLVVTNALPTASLGAPTPDPVAAGETVSVEVGGHDNDESQQSLTEGRLKLDGSVVTTVPAGQGPPYPRTLEFAAPASPGDYVLTWEVRDDEGAWSTAAPQTLHVPEPPKAPGQAELDVRFMVSGNPNPDAPGATSLCLRGIDPNGNPNDAMYALKIGADENSGWFKFGTGADKDDLFPTGTEPLWLTAAQLQDVRLRGLPAGVVCDYYARVRNAAGEETDTTSVGSCGTNKLGDVNRSGLPTALDYAYVRLAILTGTFSWCLNMDGNRIIDANDLDMVRNAVLHPLTGD